MFRDLSRPVETGMPTYPGDPDVTLTPDATHDADGYATSELRTGSHAGTHVDAPRHTLPNGDAIDDRKVGFFALDAQLVDLRPLSPREPITPAMLSTAVEDAAVKDAAAAEDVAAEDEGDEQQPPPDLLALRTGWAAHWGTDTYRDHPYLTDAAAERCREWGVGIGLDTFGPDPTPTAGESSSAATTNSDDREPIGTPAHDVLLGADLSIVENLCGLDGVPDRFRLYAFPLRLRGGDGSPVRAVAEWEE